MKPVKFTDLLKLSDKELKQLKLVFNSNWKYNPKDAPDCIKTKLTTEEDLDLLGKYKQGEVELVKLLTRLHNPNNKRFHKGELAFCFIPYGNEDWLLVNAFRVLDDSKKLINVDEDAMSDYVQYFGRLVITWKNRSTRNIRMKSMEKVGTLTVKTVLEEPVNKLSVKFPGYKNVAVEYHDLKKLLEISSEWKSYLKARKGIYLITDALTGKLYVGSAYGKDGIYGRWKTYVTKGFDKNELENGKYPNKEFQKIVKDYGMKYIQQNFRYSLLETFTDEISNEEIINRESWWKNRLLTKVFGYNAN